MAIALKAAAAGVLVTTLNDQGKEQALLQLRPYDQLNEQGIPLSYQGGAQVTSVGKLTPEEVSRLSLQDPLTDGQLLSSSTLRAALLRTVHKETGAALANLVEQAFKSTNANLSLSVLTSALDLERMRLQVTFALSTRLETSSVLPWLIPGDEVGGFVAVSDPSKIESFRPEDKTTKINLGELRMFPDERAAVIRALLKNT